VGEIAGSYRLDVSSTGAYCPPIIHTDLMVGENDSGSARIVLDGEPARATFQSGGMAFTAQFPEFGMTGPVRASGEFRRYGGRIHVDINLRWPEGTDCVASLTGSRPDVAPDKASLSAAKGSDKAAMQQPPRPAAVEPTVPGPAALHPTPASEKAPAPVSVKPRSLLDFLLKLAGGSAIGLLFGLRVAHLIRRFR
jgi:hypothetical protein